MNVAVVIPTLNEEAGIERSIRRVMQHDFHEVVVVDGGSDDRTVARARSFPGVRVLEAEPGRGRQQNAGAASVQSEALVFLHADVELPADAVTIIRHTLGCRHTVAGAFRTWTVPQHRTRGWFRYLLHLADFRSRYSSYPYGDQAIFVTRQAFEAVGGFPEQALLEDLELARRLSQYGKIRVARESVRVSGRRFESAPVKQTFWVNIFPALYRLGVPTDVLLRLYGNPR